jgi:hypothetical protein
VALILALAVGFPAYMAFGQGGSNIAAVTVTATPNFVTAPGGGGGGGVTPEEGEKCPAGEISAVDRTTTQGLIIKTIVVESFDGRFRLIIDEGTVAQTYIGSHLGCIGIHKMEGSPSPPQDAYLIGVLYDVVPDRATFSPPATLEYSYEPSSIPPEVDVQKLVIAAYDEASGGWVKLYSVVDTQAHTVTASIRHFNDLAVFGYGVEAPPPAAFQVSSLTVSPTAVYTGEAVNITIRVTNSGGQSASYQVILKIDGVVEATKEVTLDAGASTEVSFTTAEGAAGIYSVDINGATGTFEVKPRPLAPKPFNWWIIVGATAAAALAALLTYVFRAQKKYGGVSGVLAVEIGKAISVAPKLAPKAVAAVRSLFKQINKLIKKG